MIWFISCTSISFDTKRPPYAQKARTAAIFQLKNNAILEDGDLAEAVLLGLGLLTACNADDQIQQVAGGLVDGLFTVRDDTGVEVDPAGLLLGQRGVGVMAIF